MKLDTNAIALLDRLIQASIQGNIKKLIIDKDKIRGIDDKQSVVVLTTSNVPDLQGKTMAINRIDLLSARINLVKSQGNLEIEATESSSGQEIALLDLKCGK